MGVHARRRWCSAKALSIAGQMRVGTFRMGPCHRFHVQNMHLFHRNACVCIGVSMRIARMSACTHERVGVDVCECECAQRHRRAIASCTTPSEWSHSSDVNLLECAGGIGSANEDDLVANCRGGVEGSWMWRLPYRAQAGRACATFLRVLGSARRRAAHGPLRGNCSSSNPMPIWFSWVGSSRDCRKCRLHPT